ncbi:response regulator [Paenibacillus doosanensis]|uniref:response regulator n=1 Tax=Paenibacillus doosanensis TaxID=1229154 RepID=UPI00217FDC78|nr:response regulator [Paenibacillus doosanensis]MCS7459163.1 response regulator [Paenibacillus doosanensis]
MKAMLVDDENLALLQLRKMLKEIDGIEVTGAYQDAMAAIEAAKADAPDVVFLDIHMPEIYGLKAAEMLQEICPDIEIVFVTAYDDYAVQAFELNALDYVLKPVRRERLTRTVQRLLQHAGDHPKAPPASRVALIRCLQTMQIELPGLGPETVKWRTSKAQELFAYLLHHRGQLVRKGALLDLLWPDFDIPKATTHLYTTIYQVRQDLKRMGVNIEIRSLSIKESYVLDASRVRIDADEWEQELRRLEPLSAANVYEHQRVMDLYAGDYMADNDYLWAENERQRLRMLWLQHAQRLGDYYVQHERPSEAIAVFLRMQQQYPYYEGSYLALMKLHAWFKDRAAVEEQHRLLSLVLEELDVAPNESISQWYTEWKSQSAQL